jgi:hypothetical protein
VFELYNLESDSDETSDVAAQHGPRVEAMSKALDAWQRSVVGSLNGEDYD